MKLATQMRHLTKKALDDRDKPKHERPKKMSYKRVLSRIRGQAMATFDSIHIYGLGPRILERLEAEGFQIEYTAYDNRRGNQITW